MLQVVHTFNLADNWEEISKEATQIVPVAVENGKSNQPESSDSLQCENDKSSDCNNNPDQQPMVVECETKPSNDVHEQKMTDHEPGTDQKNHIDVI